MCQEANGETDVYGTTTDPRIWLKSDAKIQGFQPSCSSHSTNMSHRAPIIGHLRDDIGLVDVPEQHPKILWCYYFGCLPTSHLEVDLHAAYWILEKSVGLVKLVRIVGVAFQITPQVQIWGLIALVDP